ncbi:MAG: DUF2066 domain-containing protein [Pseudomonadota bacterium]
MLRNGRRIVAALAAIFILALPGIGTAVEVPTLYTAEVVLDEDARDARETAYRDALVTVLARVTEMSLVQNAEAFDSVFPFPEAYVTQFRPGEEDDRLWVSFDGDAIEGVLRNNGYTVWGSERPATLVWIAVDWGRGKREIIAAADPDNVGRQSRTIDRNRLLRERMLELSERRGLPIIFPLLDTTDLQSVTFSDIWGGFDERIIAASDRYDVSSVLIGRIRPSSTERNRWTYYFGNEQRTWSGPPDEVIGQVASLLASEFSVGGDDPLVRMPLSISGIETVDAYGSVQKALSEVALIEAFRIVEVAGDSIRYEVEVRGGADRLRRALRFAGLIEEEPGFGLSGDDLRFFYEP